MSDATPATRLVILDGHGIIFRAYFAVREPLVIRETGEVVTAVYGFANTLLRTIAELKPTHLALAMDLPGPTFRHEADEAYKANRAPMPEDLPAQIERCRAVAQAFNIPIFDAERYEADDVLATLADQAVEAGVETWLATLDSDLIQLVRPGVSVFMYRPYQRDTVLYDTVEKVRDRYGIDPIQMIDFKGLKGDSSDNISGVRGIGEKTAISLLNTYRTIEEIYDHIEEVTPPRAQKALIAGKEDAAHSKMMATISHDAPVTLDLDAAQVQDYDRETVVALFEELQFRSLIGRLPEGVGGDGRAASGAAEEVSDEAALDVDYTIVRDEKALKRWVRKAKKASLLAVDLETSSTDTMTCEIAGYALAVAPGEAAYVPVDHASDGEAMLSHEVVKSLLGPVLESAKVPKALHNAKFDMKVMAQHGIAMGGLREDSMIAAYLLGEPSIGLKALALSRLGVPMTPIEDLIGTGKKQISMTEVTASEAGPYAAADADMTLRLAALYAVELGERPALEVLYREMEVPLIEVLAGMERTGVALDPKALGRMSKALERESGKTEQAIYEDVGHEFLIRSPKQMSVVLFEELGLPKTRKTTQGYTTDAQALERLTNAHPVVEKVLQYRELTKLKSTYVDTLPGLVNETTGRIHTDYNQAVAATGRLSSESPNLQNIPVRTELGREIRRAFVARGEPGWAAGEAAMFLAADYSQIELRVLAHLSGDASLIEAFRQGEDIHAATASQVYGVAPEDVEADMRRVAKMMNFGVIYGLSAFGLAQRSGMERGDAQVFIDTYFERFGRVKEWIEEVKVSTRKTGWAETLLGRRRYIPEIKSSNFQVRASAERMAVNMPVQGTAADVMKLAMLQVDAAMRKQELASRMILQVHDELIFELPEGEAPEMASVLESIMPTALEMVVPLSIELKLGPNWRDMDAYDAPPVNGGTKKAGRKRSKAKTS